MIGNIYFLLFLFHKTTLKVGFLVYAVSPLSWPLAAILDVELVRVDTGGEAFPFIKRASVFKL